MEHRKLGRKEVSIVGLGGGQFTGSDHSIEEMHEIYRTAFENDVNLIDTAKDYGEEKVGKALAKTSRDRFYISTKTLSKNGEEVEKDIEDSLEKLGIDKIDLYLMHNAMSVGDYRHRKRGGVLKTLKEAKEEGLVGQIGVSSDYIEPLELAVEDGVDVIMTHYNIGNTLAKEIIKKASNKNIGVIAAKPFAGGILVDSGTEIEEGRENNLTPKKALNFILSNEKISTALVGARYPWQIEECAEVGKNFNLSDVDRERIKKEIFNFLGDDFCRDCRYCWPCEELGYDFNIPEILRFLDRYEKYGYKRFPRLGFSELSFKDRIENFDECDVSCPFDIPIGERLREAKRELDLEVSEERWKMKLEKVQISDGELSTLRESLKGKNSNEAIEHIHTCLIPESKVDEKVGLLLISGIYSFRKEKALEIISENNF